MSKRIKVGTTLIAIDECIMDKFKEDDRLGPKTLTIGKEYIVNKVDEVGYISITDDEGHAHGFHKKDIPEFFKLKDNV